MSEIKGAATESTLRRVATFLGNGYSDPVDREIRGAATEETLLRIEAALSGSGGGGLREYVEDWLEAHPEATTTVEDGSITTAKLANGAVTTSKLADGIMSLYLDWCEDEDGDLILSVVDTTEE